MGDWFRRCPLGVHACKGKNTRRKKEKLQQRYLISILLTLMLSLSFSPNLSSISLATPERPRIYVDPPTIKAAVNETFSINVSITDVVNLWSYEIKLGYDNTILNCTDAEIPPDHFLESPTAYKVKDGEIHQDEGWVWFAVALISPNEPRNGSGILATTSFQVLRKGGCPLELYKVILVEGMEGKEIPPEQYDVSHGYFVTPSKICVDPPTTKAAVNETFFINVSIVDVTNLWAYNFMLKYDNATLNCTHAEIPLGHFLDSQNSTFIVRDGEIHQDEGYVVFNATLITPEKPRNGSGILATTSFQVLGKGKCMLEIFNITLVESNEEIREIPSEAYDVYHGYFMMPSRIYVDPPKIKTPVRATFSFNVSAGITNLWGYELGLKYNNTILNCTHAGIPLGHFLDSQNNTFIVRDGEIHQDEGYVEFAVTLLGDEKPKNGSGVLGTITFQVLRRGECPLELYAIILIGAEDEIPPEAYDVAHGYFIASLYGDLNNDGRVDIRDITILAIAFHSEPGDPTWNPIADINGDEIIDIRDVTEVAREFGKTI